MVYLLLKKKDYETKKSLIDLTKLEIESFISFILLTNLSLISFDLSEK